MAVGGEPTSLIVLDPLVLVGVNTSESYDDPSGKLVVVHRNTRQIVAEHELDGQPDSLALAPDHKRAAIVIENERDEDENGDEGGSRGFTIFNQDGTVEYESNESFEHWLVSAGHYNEGRSENKGCEPEGADAGTYGGRRLLFVGSERCNAVGVYDASDPDSPVSLQILPAGIKPEGLKAIPDRNLLAASTEDDNAGDGIPTMINLYRTESGPAQYPMIESANDENGIPITWVALSGLAGDPDDPDILYAVSDSFLAEGFIYTVNVSTHPATIVGKVAVTGASESLDLEGIAVGPDGNFWLASEGNDGSRPNLVLKVDPAGNVTHEFPLPAALVANQRKNGFEGIAATGETLFLRLGDWWETLSP